jgi:uncharacterized RDD family membrane protein YckC
MKTSLRQLFLGAAIACFGTLTLVALSQDEKNTSTPPVAPAAAAEPTVPAATPAAVPAAAPEAPVAPSATPTAAPETTVSPTANQGKEPELRRLDQTPTPAPAKARTTRTPRIRLTKENTGNERVAIVNDVHLATGEKADAVVAVVGSATSEGEVADAVVSILGNSTVSAGSVGDTVVSVMGNTYVNTKIGGDAVAVMGNVDLGPKAEIGGDVVSVGGTVNRDPQAIVHGNVQNVAIAHGFGHLGGFHTWLRECLMLGRPLGFAPGLGWAWALALGFFALYLVLALIFGSSVEKCAQTLETRPGGSVLAAFLTLLLIPVLVVLLCITIVGIAVVPFLVLGLIIAGLFGKTVMLAWVGRRITKFFGPGPLSHAAVATLIGGVIVLALYTVPFVGMTIQKSFDLLGLGVVVYTLMLVSKRPKPAAPVPPAGGVPAAPPLMPMAPASPGASAAASGIEAGVTEVAPGATATLPPMAAGFAAPLSPVSAPVAPAVTVSAATLPRAGFWIRVAALALDGILVGVLAAMMGGAGKYILLLLAAYGAVMWKLKGTTIGGIVCGLKVVRLDDREIDWATAIVRALGCFLSLAVVGLGFIWVAIDDEKQSWHDKIAGTTVVRVPKGVSLL